MEALLSSRYPERLKAHRQAVRDDGYWTALESEARRAATWRGIELSGFYRH